MSRVLFRAPMAAVLALAGVLTLAGVRPTRAEDEAHYTYQELPPLPSSPFAQVPSLCINNKGHVLAKGLDQHAYLFKDGSWTDQGLVGHAVLFLNDSDEFAFTIFPDKIGFGSNGSIQPRPVGGSIIGIVAVNDSGAVAGIAQFGQSEDRVPFILHGSTVRKLGAPRNAGSGEGSVFDLNELGDTLERWDLQDAVGYFLRPGGGVLRRISNISGLIDVNDQRDIIAFPAPPSGSTIHSEGAAGPGVLIRSSGARRPLEPGLFPLALNNHAQILGFNGGEFLIDTNGTVEHNAVPSPVSLVGRGFTDAAGFVFLQQNGKIVIAKHKDDVKVKFKYETVDATENGLGRQVHEAPLEGIKIELRDQTDKVVGDARTDENGNASIPFPLDLNGRFTVAALAQTDEAVVVPPGANSSTFEVESRPFRLVPGNSDPVELLATDHRRDNGPFAILETLHAASKFLQDNAPGFEPRSIGVVWNVRSGDPPQILPGSIRLGGLRTVNSDEFDADVVTTAWVREELSFNPSLKFGGDGQGGLDLVNGAPFRLESPLAFVDGFAAFTAAAISDSTGGNAAGRLINTRRRTFVVDLEEPQVPGREQGVYDPFTVAALLWDLYDTSNEGNDAVGLGFTELWNTLVDLTPDNRSDITIVAFCNLLAAREGNLTASIGLTEQHNGIDPLDDDNPSYPPVPKNPLSNLIDPNAHSQALAQHLPRSAEGVQDYVIPGVIAGGNTIQLIIVLPQSQPVNNPQLVGLTVQFLNAKTLQPHQASVVVTPATSGATIPVLGIQPDENLLLRVTSTGSGRRATFANYNLFMSITPPPLR